MAVGNVLGDVAECMTATRWKFADDLGHPFGDYFRVADESDGIG
jgi:hypothetical protein